MYRCTMLSQHCTQKARQDPKIRGNERRWVKNQYKQKRATENTQDDEGPYTYLTRSHLDLPHSE